jgi:hypothetical protein
MIWARFISTEMDHTLMVCDALEFGVLLKRVDFIADKDWFMDPRILFIVYAGWYKNQP